MPIREATPADHAPVLALNAASVAVLSPLDAARLAHLHGQAAAFWVAHLEMSPSRGASSATGVDAADADAIAGFMLIMREGADYDSPNYRWFAQSLPSFLYVDRVVIGASARGLGLGRQFYERLFATAARLGVRTIACEIDIEPPNAGSANFHQRLGFVEVGRQSVMNGRKVVSLQTLSLNADAG